MKKFLLTGANGVVGRLLKQRLEKQGHEVVPVARDFAEHDVGASWNDADALIHCAFARSQDGAALASSLDFSCRIFALAAVKGVRRIVNISSQSVYGFHRDAPSRETDAVSPMDMYAVAKYATEKCANCICGATKTTVVNLRLASLIGSHYPERVVNKLMRYAMERHAINLLGGGQRFSFLSEDDAIEGIALIAERDSVDAGVYNLGTSEGLSLKQIAYMVADEVEARTGIPVTVGLQPSDERDFVRLVDVERVRTRIGWTARQGVNDVVRMLVSQYRTEAVC